jgi:hypothetical protein
MYCPTFHLDTQQRLKEIGQADLVIGVPGGADPRAVAHVARVALAGVHEHYPHRRTVLLAADSGRCADIHRQFTGQIPPNGHDSFALGGCYRGVAGPGSAAAAIMDAALALDAQAIVILDSQAECLSADWVAALAHLILEDKADEVLPRYRNAATAGILSDMQVYHLPPGLLGAKQCSIRGACTLPSRRAGYRPADEDVWAPRRPAAPGPWQTAFATAGGRWPMRHRRQISTAAAPAGAVSPRQFHELSAYVQPGGPLLPGWQRVGGRAIAPPRPLASTSPLLGPSPLDTAVLGQMALGWMKYRTLWRQILTPANLAQVEQLATLPPDEFYFPADLWARIIYDFAVMFNLVETDPDLVVASLLPLYQARLAAFWNEIEGLALAGREGTVAAQAVEFEEWRSYLKMQWTAHQPRFYQSGWFEDRPL